MNEPTPTTEPDVFDSDRSLTPLAAYVVTLRPLRSSVPAEIRLRRALKALLRTHGLRCVRVQAAPAGPGTPTRDDPRVDRPNTRPTSAPRPERRT